MLSLAVVASILGILTIGAGLFMVGAPALVRRGVESFPRSVWPGRILLAVDMVWSAYAVTQMHLGGFDAAKVHLYWLAPLCIILGCLYLDDLLSVRALGGLLLLVAGPLLGIARFHPSAWRLVITVMCYLWIIAGLFWVLEPWWFRRVGSLIRSDSAMRACGAVKTLAGIGFIILAITVY